MADNGLCYYLINEMNLPSQFQDAMNSVCNSSCAKYIEALCLSGDDSMEPDYSAEGNKPHHMIRTNIITLETLIVINVSWNLQTQADVHVCSMQIVTPKLLPQVDVTIVKQQPLNIVWVDLLQHPVVIIHCFKRFLEKQAINRNETAVQT